MARFDTLQGIRGEINLQIRLQFFGDMNPFKDSSAGVQFYSTDSLPSNIRISAVLGFVSTLDNEDDPEYVRPLTQFALSGVYNILALE